MLSGHNSEEGIALRKEELRRLCDELSELVQKYPHNAVLIVLSAYIAQDSHMTKTQLFALIDSLWGED